MVLLLCTVDFDFRASLLHFDLHRLLQTTAVSRYGWAQETAQADAKRIAIPSRRHSCDGHRCSRAFNTQTRTFQLHPSCALSCSYPLCLANSNLNHFWSTEIPLSIILVCNINVALFWVTNAAFTGYACIRAAVCCRRLWSHRSQPHSSGNGSTNRGGEQARVRIAQSHFNHSI